MSVFVAAAAATAAAATIFACMMLGSIMEKCTNAPIHACVSKIQFVRMG